MHLQRRPLDTWAWQCPCGARAEDKYGICRKCQAGPHGVVGLCDLAVSAAPPADFSGR